MRKFISENEEQTKNFGKEIAAETEAGSVIAMIGDLGCGKTAFVKGFMEYIGSADDVSSPTYTLVNEYDGKVPIYHFDVYRLENPSFEDCDWMDDYFFGDGICLIEWADNIKFFLPENTVYIYFSKLPEQGETVREITVTDC